MAFEDKKYLGQAGVERLITNIRLEIKEADEAAVALANEYAESLSENYDAAGTAATKVQELAEGQVKLNKEAIEKLNGDAETEGSVAKAVAEALEEAKAHADGKDEAIAAAKKAGDDAQGEVDALEEYVGTFTHDTAKTVVEYIDAEKARAEGVEGGLETRLKAVEDDHLKAADKTELQGKIDAVDQKVGSLEALETTDKDNLVEALNEVRNSVSAGGVAAQITVVENTTGLADGVAKAYVIKQGDATVGTINIPKDMVVQSGEVLVDPEGQEPGTYIKLVLANATNDEIFVNVGSLVDIYKAQANATQIQLAIDSATREISASIVAGSIGTTELADASVTTVKIADGNVTKAKLSTEVQASLDKADAAAVALAENGAVDQKIAAAEQAAKGHADDLNGAMDTRVKALEATAEGLGDLATKDIVSENELDEALKAKVNASAEANHSHDNKAELDKIAEGDKAKWDAAEQNAKDYADGLNAAMDARVKAAEEALAEGGSVDQKIATAKQEAIDAAAEDATAKADKALEDAKADASNKCAVILSEAQAGITQALADAKAYTDEAVNSFSEITADEIDALFATPAE